MLIVSLITLARPQQWLKNLMIFFPPFLGGVLFHPGIFLMGLIPFLAFCLASSASYVFNDIMDSPLDVHHPAKKNRPLTAGALTIGQAKWFFVLLTFLGLFTAASSSLPFFFVVLFYLLFSISYSLKLKQLPLVDIFCISLGFLFRLQGGGFAFSVIISDWLFLSVFLLSLFLSAGKRYGEVEILGIAAGDHRKSLLEYPAGFLDGVMYMTGATVLVTYTMYVITKPSLVYTVPLCTFGLLRYLMRVKSGQSGDPTESLLKDLPLCITGCLWVIMVGWSIY